MFSKRKIIVNKFEDIDGFPCLIGPPNVLLNVLSIVVAINVEPIAFIILTCNRGTVYVYRNLLVDVMIGGCDCTKQTVIIMPVSSGEKICIDVEACCQW